MSGPRLEFGIVPIPLPGLAAELARRAEALGFDACLFPDTQAIAGDPYIASALGAAATSRIRIGPGVTNPVTRAPSVIASAIATVQVASGGRAILGMGRGDSAAAYAGRRPATTSELEERASEVRTLLRGGTVTYGGLETGLRWLGRHGLPPVPVDIACTGARTIAAAARTADRVSFAVGAAPDRIAWALDTARTARDAAGRNPEEVRFGAYLNVVVDDDRSRARALARTGVGLVAHFAAMRGSDPQGLPSPLRPVAEGLARGYEMSRHGQGDAVQSRSIPDDFVDWFAIAGPPGYCRDRLAELAELGLRHVYVVSGSEEEGPLALVEAQAALSETVLPEFR